MNFPFAFPAKRLQEERRDSRAQITEKIEGYKPVGLVSTGLSVPIPDEKSGPD